MTVEETKKTIAQYASGKYAEFVYQYSETSGGLIGVKDGDFLFADGTSLYLEPKSLTERWDMESNFLSEYGGYWSS